MGVEDYCAWQGRRGKESEPVPEPRPLPRSADDGIDVKEHAASTTIVEQIREGLLRLIQRE